MMQIVVDQKAFLKRRHNGEVKRLKENDIVEKETKKELNIKEHRKKIRNTILRVVFAVNITMTYTTDKGKRQTYNI